MSDINDYERIIKQEKEILANHPEKKDLKLDLAKNIRWLALKLSSYQYLEREKLLLESIRLLEELFEELSEEGIQDFQNGSHHIPHIYDEVKGNLLYQYTEMAKYLDEKDKQEKADCYYERKLIISESSYFGKCKYSIEMALFMFERMIKRPNVDAIAYVNNLLERIEKQLKDYENELRDTNIADYEGVLRMISTDYHKVGMLIQCYDYTTIAERCFRKSDILKVEADRVRDERALR